jgi:hypothetical protein
MGVRNIHCGRLSFPVKLGKHGGAPARDALSPPSHGSTADDAVFRVVEARRTFREG